MGVLCPDFHCLLAARGADLTTEADSGYTPMDLAVALGYKKGKCPLHAWHRAPSSLPEKPPGNSQLPALPGALFLTFQHSFLTVPCRETAGEIKMGPIPLFPPPPGSRAGTGEISVFHLPARNQKPDRESYPQRYCLLTALASLGFISLLSPFISPTGY